MNVVRLTKIPELWEFALKNLPPSLRAYKRTDGYGSLYWVGVKERGLQSYFKSKIAMIDASEATITLYQPQYMADMQDLARAYETKTGKTVTIEYWDEAA